MKTSLVVLAAGMGSRYGGLKQIDPVGPGGEVILDYSVFDAIRAGFDRVVFVIRRDIEAAFREALGSRFESRIEVAYAFQELEDLPAGLSLPEGRSKPWGTMHATLAARKVVDGPFAVINADDYYGSASFEVLATALKQREASSGRWCMVGFPLQRTLSDHGTVSRGLCALDDEQHLSRVEECHEIHAVEGGVEVNRNGATELVSGERLVSMNMWGFTPDVFQSASCGFREFYEQMPDPLKSEYYLPSLVQEQIDAGKVEVEVLRAESDWLGVTYPDDKARVQAGLQSLHDQGLYPTPLW